MRSAVVVTLCLLLLAGGPLAATATATETAEPVSHSPDSDDPTIVELYPNPPANGDPGEFVTIEFPAGTNVSEFSLADANTENPLDAGNRTILTERTRLTFSAEPNKTAQVTDRTVRSLSARLQLSNRGDTIRLHNGTETVDTVTYDRAAEATVYNARTAEWHPLGATERAITAATGGSIETFVLPDNPDRAIELLASARNRIYLAGYTLSSQRVVEALTAANARGVTVEVLVEGSPVGGMSGYAAAALDTLDREGVDVRVIAGDRARYRFHHAKYAIVDQQALVTSENWKPAGTGGRSSRGWGAITDQQPIVSGLVDTFHADTGWVDAVPWNEFDDLSIVEEEPADGNYPTEFETESFAVERTELLLAPDNAEQRLLELIENAEESIQIKQVRIGNEEFPFLEAVLDAAERGVEVEILLDGAWYVEDENEQLQTYLNEQATAGDLPLETRLAGGGDSFEKIHAKGLIVDGEKTVLGSINWTNNSIRHNREVALLIESEDVAAYFGAVFASDWSESSTDTDRQLPVGLALAGLFVGALAVLGARELQFAQ